MSKLPPARLLDTAVRAAQAAGSHALANTARRRETSETFDHDIKLVLDVECQQIAEEVITAEFPGHEILGEEYTRSAAASDYEWIIDPIDGTVNYSHGFPYWCSSVAVRRRNEIVAGCVYAPEFANCYTAHVEETAQCNGKPIRVADTQRLDQALIFSGLSKHIESEGQSDFARFRKLLLNTQKVRINGAAALDICHVAAGLSDGFFETHLYLWDHAAAGLIAQQAGAVMCLYPNESEPHCTAVLCANQHLIDGLRSVLEEEVYGNRL
jgi:myo-inositol-1(or 4)-monophosphatase